MKTKQLLHNLDQSVWLDDITRGLLEGGTLKHYIEELSETGLTLNRTIFDHAIKNKTGSLDVASRLESRFSQSSSRSAVVISCRSPRSGQGNQEQTKGIHREAH